MRALVILLALAACVPTPEVVEEPLVEPADDLPNPLVPEVALLPWPSDQYLVADATTVTGRRMSLPGVHLPEGLTPEAFSDHDGISRVAPLVAWLPGGFDDASLPDAGDPAATLAEDSAVMVVRADTGERMPMLVERDLRDPDPVNASLLMRAHRPFAPNATYVVLLRRGLRAVDGTPHAPSQLVQRLLEGTQGDDRAERYWASRYQVVRETLDGLGVAPDDVVLAWTFTTRSEEDVTGEALALQDLALQAPSDRYTLDAPSTDASCAPDCVVVSGTFTAPWYLDGDSRLVVDAGGAPVKQRDQEVPFLLTVPTNLDGPRPVVLFGHGFFSAIEEPTWSNLFRGLSRWRMAAVTTKFYGFAEEDLLQSASIVGGDLSDLDTVMDQQLQSHANFTLLHRLLAEHLADDLVLDLQTDGVQPLDGDAIHYMGISNGGTQGLVMMTTSPLLDRGALIVPGGGWSHMVQRATQWDTLGSILARRYPDARQLQVVLSLLQQVFDPVDSLNYVEHMASDRLEGRKPEVDLLVIEARDDSQVTNLVTEWVVRASGIPQLTPTAKPVWDVPTVAARPGDGVRQGYEVYDLGRTPAPTGNVASPVDNDVHNDVRLLDAYREQVGRFLETGEVVHTCDGPCDPE